MPPNDLNVLDDDVLLRRAGSGDRPAFGELIRRHQRAALRLAAVISGSSEEADDIVQEAFINVHRGLSTYRGSASVRSWILRIVANQAKNHVRGRIRRLRRDDRHAGLQLHWSDATESAVLDRAAHEELAAAVGRLQSADRAVLGCRFVADLSEAETAQVLGLPVGTVKSRTSRALTRLRSILEADR